MLNALRLASFTVVAEEETAAGRVSAIGHHFFLVDPLDGTKEFLSGNGEFTVNIAEVVDGVPVAGAVYAPAASRLFYADALGAFELALAPQASPQRTQRPRRKAKSKAERLRAKAKENARSFASLWMTRPGRSRSLATSAKRGRSTRDDNSLAAASRANLLTADG